MIPFFNRQENWLKYRQILEDWIGTPYRHLTMVKGRGADCTLYLAAAMLEMKILTKVEHDYYPKEWFRHTTKELVMEGFFEHIENNMTPGLNMIWLGKDADLMRGDIVAFSTAGIGATNHCAIMMSKQRMINSIEQGGVQILTYGSWWERRLKSVFRVVEV